MRTTYWLLDDDGWSKHATLEEAAAVEAKGRWRIFVRHGTGRPFLVRQWTEAA